MRYSELLCCFDERELFDEQVWLAVSVDEVYALEELFKGLSNSIHRASVVYHACCAFLCSQAWLFSLWCFRRTRTVRRMA